MKRFLRMSYLAASIGGVGFFAMSVLLLGVWPGETLDRQIRAMEPEHPLALSASETRGRAIYAREGCAYCHTQQIRYLQSDVARFGRATLAWETLFDTPQLWGTRRIGPDLSREAGIRSSDWQFTHLYSPILTVADSVMPAFPWLFDGAPDRPNQSGSDLLAYLETLGRGRALAGLEGEAHARGACNCPADEAHFAFETSALNASPAAPRRSGSHPPLAVAVDPERGRELYSRNCASCHGSKGAGDGPAASGLRPRPANFSQHVYTLDRLSEALWNGVAGSAMPAWRDLSAADLAALALTVRTFATPGAEPALPSGIADAGARVYADRCAQCHGDHGAGDGPAAAQLAIAPTNFQTQRPSFAASLRAVRDGVEGTPMAPWVSQLDDAGIYAAGYFVRSFFHAERGGPSQ